MNIGVVGGTGYVGITLACLADFGHDVVLVGRTKKKVDLINKGVSPIYELGLEKILKMNVESGKVHATTDYKDIGDADVIFICVGTPSREDGSINLSDIKEASSQVARCLSKEKYHVIVVKSTVVPGTTIHEIKPVLEKHSDKKCGQDFSLCMNPEFLREGVAVEDFLNPDKIVIGCYDDKSYSVVERVYEGFDKKIPRIKTNLTTAEMIKYVQNSFLAVKISFINQMANLSERYDEPVDVYEVAHAIGLDPRIGPHFLRAGIGFGGSCFPKDVRALIAQGKELGYNLTILEEIMRVNEKQPYRVIELIKEVLGDLENKTIAVLGLAFKSDTDDMRESPTIPIIKTLVKDGAKIKAYDPQAEENTKKIFGDSIEYCSSPDECINGADVCLFLTEWKEFKNLNLSKIKCPIVDGKRVLDPNEVKKHGLVYRGIGWKN